MKTPDDTKVTALTDSFENAEFIVTAVNAYASNQSLLAAKDKTIAELREALELAFNTVECASCDPITREELPWYKNAKRALHALGQLSENSLLRIKLQSLHADQLNKAMTGLEREHNITRCEEIRAALASVEKGQP